MWGDQILSALREKAAKPLSNPYLGSMVVGDSAVVEAPQMKDIILHRTT